MSLWQRLKSALSRIFWPRKISSDKESNHIAFMLDEHLSFSLAEIAQLEQRPREEIASELLSAAIERRRLAEEYLEIWRGLTRREQEVAALVCLDYTYREIGERLSLSPQTIKSHVRNLLHKFNLRRKVDLRRALADWDFSEWDPFTLPGVADSDFLPGEDAPFVS